VKQLEVTIMGQSYILACPEGRETQLLEAVGSVDREMCVIRDAGKVKARERIAVLAALNLAYVLADKPDPASTPEPAAASTEGSEATPLQGDHQAQLDALVKRLDASLGQDGQLL
jgi:cell division protein ZapA